jgi:hypothetical protein
MKGYVFDPKRLGGTVHQQRERGEAVTARMLREFFGGAPLADLHDRLWNPSCEHNAVQRSGKDERP